MKINVILKENNRDKFTLTEADTYYIDSIFTNPNTTKLTSTIVKHNFYRYFKTHKISPQNSLVGDFANMALCVYAIDQVANRDKFGLHGWSRYIHLHIPVYNTEKWELVKTELEQILSFLSGDKWVLNLRKSAESFPSMQSSVFKAKKVCLFSGGMDSFIGVNDLINKNDEIATISHHKRGNSGELSLQKELIGILKQEYINKNIHPFYFYVQGQKNNSLNGEKTQRARSIIFLALGLLIANTSSDKTNIVIPENGLISLNLPLTPARGGSHSTKTTHPKYLSGLNKIFEKVGISNKIENPYYFLTKGEMLEKCSNPDFVRSHIRKTLSCSKPGYHKQWTKRKTENNKSVSNQCGYCVPCIIRRASLFKNKLDSEGDYVTNAGKHHIDYRAFELATFRYNKKNKIMLEFLKAGKMNLSKGDIKKYTNMYYRGIKEVGEFIRNN